MIAKRLREANELKKKISDQGSRDAGINNPQRNQPAVLSEFEKEFNAKKIIPRTAIDNPSHRDKVLFHKEHHKPIESVIKDIENKHAEKNVTILSPSYNSRQIR